MSVSPIGKVEIPPVKLVVVGNESKPLAKIGDSRIEQFLDLKDIAPKTRKTYEQQLRWFSGWVGKDWLQVGMNDIRGYKLYLIEDKGLKPNSVALALATLKGFYRWMIQAGLCDRNPLDGVSIPRSPEAEGKNLEQYQVEKLFQALEERGETQERDVAILCLLFYCGLRASEVSNLNVGDYNGVEVLVRRAKHNSTGPVPANDQTDQALQEYLLKRWQENGGELSEEEPMFVSYSNKSRGQRLGYQGIYYLVKAIAKAAGIDDVHPHRGRHTFASELIESGMDAYLAMQLMRNKTVKVFQGYSQKVKYRAARADFFQRNGGGERKVRSLEEILKG